MSNDQVIKMVQAAEARAEAAERTIKEFQSLAVDVVPGDGDGIEIPLTPDSLKVIMKEIQGEWDDAEKRLAALKNSGGPCGHAGRFFAKGECHVCRAAAAQARLAVSEAACAAMRNGLLAAQHFIEKGIVVRMSNQWPALQRILPEIRAAIQRALDIPAGQGFLSPMAKETETLRAELAACREALELTLRVFKAMSDRGAYPIELCADEAACLTGGGWHYITTALSGQRGRELLDQQRAKDEVLAGFVEGARAKDQRIATLTDLLRRAMDNVNHDGSVYTVEKSTWYKDAALVLGDKS